MSSDAVKDEVKRESPGSPPASDHAGSGSGSGSLEELAIQAPAVRTKRSRLQAALLMTSLCTAVFLAALDITIVTTALPTISDHFHSTSGYTWVGSAFLLAAAVVAPSWGKFSDIWGRKTILLIVTGIFFLGSALCGAAVSLSMLLVGRVIQGIGGGGLLSLVSIVVGDLYSPRERGKYYGIVGLVWAVAFTLGPLVGGAFTRGVSWRWCFYINLPISGVAFILIVVLLKLQTPKTPFVAGIKAVDWVGTVTLVGGTLMFLLGLELGGTTYPWNSVTVICLIVFGIVTVALFVVVERYLARYPIVPVHLYSSVSNFSIFAVNLLHGIVLTENTYFLPLYCQAVLGAEPFLSGVLLLPFAVSMSVATVGTGAYLKKTGRYLDCIYLGFALMALGVGLFHDLPSSTSWPRVILYQIISGFGIGLNFQPPLIALQNSVPPADNASATASFGLVRNVASAIGVVIGSVAFANTMNDQQDELRAALGPSTAELFTGSNAQANVLLVKTLPEGAQQRDLVRRAFRDALRNIWTIGATFAGAALLVSFLIKHKSLQVQHVEVKTGLEGEEERRRAALEQRAAKKAAKAESSE
ncbi:major facilitator superfamily-domain-containing protein [Thermothelomyces heterothallicus CBS 202.75]|uniref:major facilitator superfamily-domain-containing protein n=1 Tax=Thermothelomyces heterothallicus CBS 202.75 TaxID=1149848 RepID=UPI0037445ED2